MNTPVRTTFLTERVGMRRNRVAPRWVPVLLGLCIGGEMLAVESHGAARIVTALVALGMLLTLALAGRRRVVPRD